jgi:hypothetical protein
MVSIDFDNFWGWGEIERGLEGGLEKEEIKNIWYASVIVFITGYC